VQAFNDGKVLAVLTMTSQVRASNGEAHIKMSPIHIYFFLAFLCAIPPPIIVGFFFLAAMPPPIILGFFLAAGFLVP